MTNDTNIINAKMILGVIQPIAIVRKLNMKSEKRKNDFEICHFSAFLTNLLLIAITTDMKIWFLVNNDGISWQALVLHGFEMVN